MRAMAAQKPCVVQRHDRRNRAAELWNCAEVEIKTMEIVAVENVRSARRQLEKIPCSGIVEVLDTLKIVQKSCRLGDPFGPSAQTTIAIHGLTACVHPPPEPRPPVSMLS